MVNPINITQIAYLMQHVAQLKSISRSQAITLAVSSLGAALSAVALVQPLDYKLIALAFVGALVTNAYHLLQTPPAVVARTNAQINVPDAATFKGSQDDVFGVKK